MKPREQIMRAHEDAVIEVFIKWLNSKQGTNFKVISKPDPPDAIAQDGNQYIWIEHADIFRSWEEARETISSVTPGEDPYERKEHPIFSPDQRIALAFIATLNKKLSKTSYETWYKKYGQGFLILTEQDPLFNQSSWECINEHLAESNFDNDKGYFKSVFLGYRCMIGLDFIEVCLNNSQQINPADPAQAPGS